MALPKWTRLLDRSKRQTFHQPPSSSDHLDSSVGFIDCNCKAKKQVEKYYRYIRKRLDQLEYDKYRLRSEHDDINTRENQLSKSIWQLRARERELDDYCAYLNEKRQSIDTIYTKCEALEVQLNDRFNEYNNMQKDLKKRVDDLDQWQNNLAIKEQQIDRMSRDLELRERDFIINQSKMFQERNYQKLSESRQDYGVNGRSIQQCMMEIENERRKLEMDRQNFSQYYEGIMEELERKFRKLTKVGEEYRAKEDDILNKERKLLSNMEGIQQAWGEIEEARLDIIKQREQLKRKIVAAEAAAEAAMQNSISLQQQLMQKQQANEESTADRRNGSNRDIYEPHYNTINRVDPHYNRPNPEPHYNRPNPEPHYNVTINGTREPPYTSAEPASLDPRLQQQIQDRMSDITKLVEDIKKETSLIAMEKYSLQGQKKQFEMEKEISERELAAKKQQLLNLEQKLRKNDLMDQTTPTTIDGQLNGYYSDKVRMGDSSTRFTDMERDMGGFFLDKSADYSTAKRMNPRISDFRNNNGNPKEGMRDIADYGKVR